MSERHIRIRELIKRQFNAAYYESKTCHERLFKADSFEREQKALIYLYRAVRHMDRAYTIYQYDLEELEDCSITSVFHTFNVFYREVTDCVATNHSHQWSDIEFNSYKESLYDWVPEARKED